MSDPNEVETIETSETSNGKEVETTTCMDQGEGETKEEENETVEKEEIEEKEEKEKATPFLDVPLDDLKTMNAADMEALLEKMVKETTPEQIQAQKDVHDAEIESMQSLMMEAQAEGLMDEDDGDQEEVDEDGQVKQSTADGAILLKNKAGDHNPILDDLRKKQMRGQLSPEEEQMLERALTYQQKMTGASGSRNLTETAEQEEEQECNGKKEEELKDPQDDTGVLGQEQEDANVFVLSLPCDLMQAAVRGITLPLVSSKGSAQVPGNSLVTTLRIFVNEDISNDVAFVIGTVRGGGNPQDPDNKPQRWADVKSPITGAELNENGCIEIECVENDVVFNTCMIGITLLSGNLPKSSMTVSLTTVALDENEIVGAVGTNIPKAETVPTTATAVVDTSVKPNALQRAMQRQQGVPASSNTNVVVQKKQQAAPLAVPQVTAVKKTATTGEITKKKGGKSRGSKKGRRFAPASDYTANIAKNQEEEIDPCILAEDETHTLAPQIPLNKRNQPLAPTRKQLAADPNNPKFDPLPEKERLNLFSTNEEGQSVAPKLPPGIAGYAADGTPIPIVNDGEDFNPQIPDVFSNREYRNKLMASQYEPEKDIPMIWHGNRKIKFAVVSVIGPKHCRIKTDRCVMRVWGFAKNKKECEAIAKWVRNTAYMGYLWDIGVVPIKSWFPVPPIYAEDSTSTYSNPLHREYMEAYLNEQKRATVELEQRVLDDKITRQKGGNTMVKQLRRQEEERQNTARQLQNGENPIDPADSNQSGQPQSRQRQNQKIASHRAPLAQRIRT